MDYLRSLFSSSGFMPHGHCYFWQPGILWLHIVSDTLIALAYFAITLGLLYFVRRRKDIGFRPIFVFFAVFIGACGVTHTMEIWVIWNPTYWLSGTCKALTAVASVSAAAVFLKFVPGALRLPALGTLLRMNEVLEKEVGERKRAELEVRQVNEQLESRVHDRTRELEVAVTALEKEVVGHQKAAAALRESQQLLQAISDNAPVVLYAKDLEGHYLFVNRRYLDLFNTGVGPLIGKTDRDIFPTEVANAFRAMDLRVAQAGVALTSEEVAPHEDGLHTYISVKCPLRGPDGRVSGIVGISTDISGHRQAAEVGARLAAIVRASDDAIISTNLDGKVTSWNTGAERLFGYPMREMVGRSILAVVPPERLAEESHISAAIVEGETIEHFETVRIRKDGTPIDVSVTCSPIRDSVGIIIGISKIARDISDRKRAEIRMREQLGRLALLNQITSAIGERQDLGSIFQTVVRSLEDQLPVDFSCVCLYDPVAEVMTVKNVGIRSEALAMELAMGEKAQIPIDRNGLSRSIQGQFVYEPDVAELDFPFPQRLLRGGLRSLVIAPLQVESRVFGILIAARVPAAGFDSGDCEFLRQLSQHVALASHHTQLYTALQAAYEDLRQTQQAVVEQERLRVLGQMASGIAHDINNAITPAGLYAESLLEGEPNLSARARNSLETIQRALDDVAHTVSRMREFCRQRKPNQEFVPVDLNRIVGQVIDLSRARWNDMPQKRGIVIMVNFEAMPRLPMMMGLESEIREALINIVFNGVDAMPQGGTLTLRTGVGHGAKVGPVPGKSNQVMVEVADTGAGMDEKTRNRCMEPFFTTKGERGTGLGLAMVYGIVTRHGGEIEIDSEPGQGTRVRLIFPLMMAEERNSEHPESGQRANRSLRILLIDDDPLLLRSLRDVLENDGHEIVEANGGQAGIDAFQLARKQGRLFDVVITDLGMPYVDGRRVARVIKQASASTPVILLTGWGQRMVEEDDIPPYIDLVLNKPPKMRDLREALIAVLAEEEIK